MDATQIIEAIEIADVLFVALGGSAAVSEVLPHVSKVKSNSTIQLIFNTLKLIVGLFAKKK